MTRAVAYCRVSTGEQARYGVSLEAQQLAIETYCRIHELELVKIYIEEGVSGGISLGQRPQGKLMLRQIEQEGIENFVALKLDRVYRSAIDALTQTERFTKQGTAVHFVDLNIDTSTPMGKMLLSLMASFAELEKNMTAERTRAAMQHKKKNRQVYNHTPYGYDRDGDRLVENEQEQQVLARVREQRAQGASYAAICRQLEQDGVPTKQGKQKWYPATIKYILDNELNK